MTRKQLGRYDIIRVLGKGAMGLVYEARDPNLDRRVAIKTIKVENLSEEAAVEYEARFRTEARSAARLQHPNIVSVYDSGRDGDIAFLVMEFIQGDDLKHHLDNGKRYSLGQSQHMVRDLLSALEYAHRQNIVHRDVKPANLLIEADGRVKLTDFGVARIQDSGEATRTKGSMVGTLKYMSPEQVQGQPVDARSDLFAAGIVLYQLLCGKRPFDGDGEFAIIHQIVGVEPASPSSFNALLPPAIDAVVAQALAKRREQRFRTAHDFALALQEACGLAPDPTIVPARFLGADRPGFGTGSGSQRSRTGGSTVKLRTSADDSGSTVTQELELVYWKDVKDSDDAEDLAGFLGRFPQGIYADLARRRLRKLGGSANSAGSLTGTATVAIPFATDGQPEPTLLQSRAVPAVASAAATTPARGDERTEVTADAESRVALSVVVAATDVSATAADQTVAATSKELAQPSLRVPSEPAPHNPPAAAQPVNSPPSEAPATSPAAAQSGAKKPLFVLAGVVALVVAGVLFKLLSDGAAPGDEAMQAPTVQAPVARAAASLAAPASAATEPVAAFAAPSASRAKPGPVTVTPRASAANPAASRSALGQSAPVATAQGGTAAASGPRLAAAKPVPVEAIGAAPAPPPGSNPRQACESRVLLGFQSCLNEQCAKQQFTSHPVCVERRAMEKARQETEKNTRN